MPLPAEVTAMICLADLTENDVADTEPNRIAVAFEKPVPVIVTDVSLGPAAKRGAGWSGNRHIDRPSAPSRTSSGELRRSTDGK